MTTDIDNIHLGRAIDLARRAAAAGNRPFGAVVVDDDGDVVAEGENAAITSGNPTRHAELAAIADTIGAGYGPHLVGATVYASGEPCPMCATAMVLAGITRIVFAAATADFAPYLPPGGPMFTLTCAEVAESGGVPVVVEGPVPVAGALEVFAEYAAAR
ncbi:deaminase [Nocardia halotolerans]|uniref:Deaminase n=1 Tax=Nocardia halotolerans TaxID=1755878 RepID=A0ABV8VPL0_9NOCA